MQPPAFQLVLKGAPSNLVAPTATTNGSVDITLTRLRPGPTGLRPQKLTVVLGVV
jgi:hypothetical protein